MKLVKGKGAPGEGACLMSAVAWYAGEKDWTDAPECVCPTIRAVGIRLNDSIHEDAERERICGPLIFEVMGTRSDDPAVMGDRKRICVEFAIERARSVLGAVPAGEDRPRLAIEAAEAWLANPCEETSRAARAAAWAASAADAAYAAARAAASAADAAYAAARAAAYAAASAAADAAAYAAYAAYAAESPVPHLLELLKRLCAVGERVEVRQVRSLEELV